MFKFKWIWVPEGILLIIGATLMASPFMGPMNDLSKFIVITVGFGIFMIGSLLDGVIQKIKEEKIMNAKR